MRHMDFLHSSYDNGATIQLIHQMALLIVSSLKRFASKGDIGNILFEALKFGVPSRGFGVERNLPWIFDRNSTEKAVFTCFCCFSGGRSQTMPHVTSRNRP